MAEAEAADLDAEVRRADGERWASSRFIGDAQARADVTALYALNQELGRALDAASTPMLAEIRLTWWSEAAAEITEGRPVRRHPVTLALADQAARGVLEPARLEALVEARFAELDDPAEDEPLLLARLDGTAGLLTALAARRLDPEVDPHAVRGAARAYGLSGLLRRRRAGLATPLPGEWDDAATLQALDRQLADAAAEVRRLSPAAFPAVAHAALARPAALRPLSPLEQRARLTWAVLRGRVA